MEVYVGVDWARYEGVALAVAGDREKRFKYERTVAGIDALVAALRRFVGTDCVVRTAIEGGDHAIAVLLSKQKGFIVHVVDPKQAKRHAESLRSSRAKDDARDARNLALMAQSEKHRGAPFSVPDAKREALDIVMSELESSDNRQQRLVNQLRAKLVAFAPAIDRAFRDVTTKRALALIEMAPTAAHGQANTPEVWADFCRTHKVHMKDRERLLDAARAPWRELPSEVSSVVAKQIRFMVQELRAATASRDAVDSMLEELMREDPKAQRLQTIKGVGTTIAAMLTALGATEANDRDELAMLVGVAPVTIESGKTRVVSQRYEVSSLAKRASFLLGLGGARWLTWGKSMYADGRARKQSHAHATRRVGRSMLRIIHSMLTKGTDHDEDRYIASLKARGVKWAAELGTASPTSPAPDSGATGGSRARAKT